jgi:hypothetical protein
VADARALLNDILRSPRTGQAALQYGTTLGDPALRRLTARRLRRLDRARGNPKAYSPERMIITSGSQQLLYMVTEALCDAGDIVLVEDLTAREPNDYSGRKLCLCDLRVSCGLRRQGPVHRRLLSRVSIFHR